MVRVNGKAAVETAQWAFGKRHALLTGLLTWIPYLIAIAAIPAAFILGRVAALLLAPVALFAMVVAGEDGVSLDLLISPLQRTW